MEQQDQERWSLLLCLETWVQRWSHSSIKWKRGSKRNISSCKGCASGSLQTAWQSREDKSLGLGKLLGAALCCRLTCERAAGGAETCLHPTQPRTEPRASAVCLCFVCKVTGQCEWARGRGTCKEHIGSLVRCQPRCIPYIPTSAAWQSLQTSLLCRRFGAGGATQVPGNWVVENEQQKWV